VTVSPRASPVIDGKGRTVRELLAGRKYSIDYYQREYIRTRFPPASQSANIAHEAGASTQRAKRTQE
jgi:hypothetical protein